MTGARDEGRLTNNFGLGILSLGLAALLPVGAIAGAELAGRESPRLIGLAAIPAGWAFALLLLARTLANYWVHRGLHRCGAGWRVHRVHHRDLRIDLSTSLRNHPAEAVLLATIAFALSYALQPPVAAVIAVDLVLILANFWSHGDIRLPGGIEAALSPYIVTPGGHRVHHARDAALHDRNFGDVVMIWDRLFGTFHPPVRESVFGLDEPPPGPGGLLGELVSPVRR